MRDRSSARDSAASGAASSATASAWSSLPGHSSGDSSVSGEVAEAEDAADSIPSFDQRVYAVVAQIPHGRLATYGQVAELIGAWGCARQVGWALKRLPLPSELPWHRVVNAQGRISLSVSREGSDWMQVELLRREGISVDEQGRLPLARHRWVAPCALSETSHEGSA